MKIYALTPVDLVRLRALCKVNGRTDFNELARKPKIAKGLLNKIKWTKTP